MKIAKGWVLECRSDSKSYRLIVSHRSQRKTINLETKIEHKARDKAYQLYLQHRDNLDAFFAQSVTGTDNYEEILEAFLKSKSSKLKQSSLDDLRRTVRIYFTEYSNTASVTNVRERDLLRFLTRADLRPDTLNKHYVNLQGFFKYLVRKGYIEQSPMVDRLGNDILERPKKVRRKPKYFTMEELDIITITMNEYCNRLVLDGKMREKVADALRIRTTQAIWLSVGTGLRRSELCHLRWEDVDFEQHLIYVRGWGDFSPKSYHERAIPIAPMVGEILEQLDRKTKTVLPSPEGGILNGDRTSKFFKKMVVLSGVKQQERNWHCLRHTFASLALQNGTSLAQLRDWLGHESIKTTEIYAHLIPHDTGGALSRAFPKRSV